MSTEMMQLVTSMNMKKLDTQLALQCAPVLMNYKISNLLIVEREKISQVMQLFPKTELSCKLLMVSEEKAAFLIYREKELISYLESMEVRKMMESFGYNKYALNEILQEFSKRYTKYVQEDGDFPHEMGLLLGYPVEDVAGFIQNEGENFLYSGYWKVYTNLSEALEHFERYNQAKEIAVRMISEGENILHLIGNSKVNTEAFQDRKWKQVMI